MTLARLRWKTEGRKLTLADGTTWKLPRRMPENVRQEIARLPHDYLELGHRCADLHDDVRLAKRDLATAYAEAQGWQMKFENIKGKDVDTLDKIVAILSDDLELACNLLIRISVALGIQPGGEFYNKIKDLVEKYGMTMHYAKNYKPEGATIALDQGKATVEITDYGTVELKPVLPPGHYEIPGEEGDPFDYHIHVWEDEGGNGTLHDEVSEKGQLEEDMLQELEERKRQND